MTTPKVRLLLLIVALLAVTGCPKVKPTPYQLGLKAYYSALLSGKTEESLNAAIVNLDAELKKSPADPGMLALRASSYLELLRLKAQDEKTYHGEYARSLFRDLRLLQTHADQSAAKLWLRPRLSTMAADAFLLRAESMPRETDARSRLIQSARQGAFYQLAADFYQHAWTAAQVEPSGDDADAQAAGLEKEKANARDGYANALSGVAKTRRVQGFREQARTLTQQVIDLLTTPELPAPTAPLTPGSLYAYSHTVLASQYQSMENLTKGSYLERVSLAETALREDFASRMLRSTADLSFSNDQISTRLQTYYAARTAQTRQLTATGGGDLPNQVVSFEMLPGPQYVIANFSAIVEYVSLRVGDTTVRVDLGDAIVPPAGATITIHSKVGTSQGLVRFLNRGSSLFATGNEVEVLAPGDNVIGTEIAQ